MTFIGAESAYALYPISTFDQQRSLSVNSNGLEVEMDRKCFSLIGCKTVDEVKAWEATSIKSEWKAGTRFVGDKMCWVHKLPGLDAELLYKEGLFFQRRGREALHGNSWELAYDELDRAFIALLVVKYTPQGRACFVTARVWKDDWPVIYARTKATYDDPDNTQ